MLMSNARCMLLETLPQMFGCSMLWLSPQGVPVLEQSLRYEVWMTYMLAIPP